MFPLLPRWFTAALRARPRRATSVHFPENEPLHDHALLESLNKSVFEHRFINMKPSGKSVVCVWTMKLISASCITYLLHDILQASHVGACCQLSNASFSASATITTADSHKIRD